jgi:hypothetical protein
VNAPDVVGRRCPFGRSWATIAPCPRPEVDRPLPACSPEVLRVARKGANTVGPASCFLDCSSYSTAAGLTPRCSGTSASVLADCMHGSTHHRCAPVEPPYVTRLVRLFGRCCGSSSGHLREVSVKARLCLLVVDAIMAPCRGSGDIDVRGMA